MKKTHKFLLTTQSIIQATQELHTLRDILRWGLTQLNRSSVFYGHGTDNALDDLIYLMTHTLKLDPQLDEKWLDARLTTSEKTLLFKQLQCRINEHIPVAYLIQQAWFAGLSFYVDERVLIPRSPLAELIEQQLQPWVVDPNQIKTILDLCTGSACIAVACAYAFTDAKIIATDVSKEALAVAEMNLEKHELTDQIQLIQSDLFCQIPSRKYQIIISNPPYVSDLIFKTLPNEYHHEPALALRAQQNGLEYVFRILKQAQDYLTEDGLLIVEVGEAKQALIDALPHVPFMWLAFTRGESEVFLLTYSQLKQSNLAQLFNEKVFMTD
jgi:ribosomal protein L3 glutamine methyltransferase